MPGVLTIERTMLAPGRYVVVSWEAFAALMQSDPDFRPRSVHYLEFTIPPDPPEKETPPTGGEAL